MRVDDAANLEDYLKRFEYTIPLLQSAEAIERVSYEMVEDAARDGIRYLEVRYCPWLSRHQGLSMERALEAELAGLARGERDFGVVARVINCSLRHYDPAVSLEIARLSVAYRDRGVVAFDLAGGEAGRPAGAHRAAFDVAAEGRLGITVHAGEAAGAASIADAVDHCHADRIGHGTRLYEDPALLDYLRDRRILHRDQHHQQRPDPRRRRRGGPSGSAVLRRGPRRDALHRRLAHVRRHPQRRILAGAHARSGSPARRSTR